MDFNIFIYMFEINVPDKIGVAKVICYAVVNLSIPTHTPQNLAYGIAICQYKLNEGYYLFYCDRKWKEFADTWHETIEDAQDQAECDYTGINNNWIRQ
jgi:hypothetical protein